MKPNDKFSAPVAIFFKAKLIFFFQLSLLEVEDLEGEVDLTVLKALIGISLRCDFFQS